MRMIMMMAGAALAASMAVPAVAKPAMQTPTAAQFVAKAGASDMFERREAKMMMTSSNSDVRNFAQRMMTDHTKSTEMVKAAAKADGMNPAPPTLNPMQKRDIGALAAAKGTARDRLYLQQQMPAHQKALALMRSYAHSGKSMHLKQAAAKIAPVVESHIDMLQKMPKM